MEPNAEVDDPNAEGAPKDDDPKVDGAGVVPNKPPEDAGALPNKPDEGAGALPNKLLDAGAGELPKKPPAGAGAGVFPNRLPVDGVPNNPVEEGAGAGELPKPPVEGAGAPKENAAAGAGAGVLPKLKAGAGLLPNAGAGAGEPKENPPPPDVMVLSESKDGLGNVVLAPVIAPRLSAGIAFPRHPIVGTSSRHCSSSLQPEPSQ